MGGVAVSRRLWAGLDVGVETTSICVIDDRGDVLQEASCPTSLNSIHREIRWLRRRRSARVGIETNGASIARGLRNFGYSVDLYETRQLSKFLRVRRNKTDAGDASGIAEAGRIGASLISRVHLKSLECQSLQSRLTIRRHLVRERVRSVNLLCRQIELYGGRVSGCTRSMRLRPRIEAELKQVFGRSDPCLVRQLHLLLDRCEELLLLQNAIDRDLRRMALENEVCRRFMQIPGVGPLCAWSFYAAVGEPARFRRSAAVGSYFGLVPKLHESGLTVHSGRISKMGNKAARGLLVHAAVHFARFSPDCALHRWTARIELTRGKKKARVALARKLATLMLAMWKSGESYNPRYGESDQA
jgi:transposase